MIPKAEVEPPPKADGGLLNPAPNILGLLPNAPPVAVPGALDVCPAVLLAPNAFDTPKADC